MNHQLPPLDKIKVFFPKHRICVVKTLLLLLDCVIQCRTVNLNKCKCKAFAATGQKEGNLGSVYTRFIRFFKIKHADSFCLGVMLLILNMLLPHGTAHLVIDRTNWEIGKTKINILCIGFLLPNGVFIPVMWETLPKKGNSSEKESDYIETRAYRAAQTVPGSLAVGQSVSICRPGRPRIYWLEVVRVDGEK